jgi:hypothetical protein
MYRSSNQVIVNAEVAFTSKSMTLLLQGNGLIGKQYWSISAPELMAVTTDHFIGISKSNMEIIETSNFKHTTLGVLPHEIKFIANKKIHIRCKRRFCMALGYAE